ncbi:MAG: PAS domain S-box protein [Polyangiaceae bacterium]|nr:PAS domain S-box protein [Polyangiaceae bacterium]
MGEVEDLRRRVAELTRALDDRSNMSCTRPATVQPSDGRRAVMDAAPLVLVAFDRDGIYTIHEGRGDPDSPLVPGALVGKSIYDVYGDVPGAREAVTRSLGGETVRWEARNGRSVFDVFFVPVRDAEGAVRSVTGIAIDITKRDVAEVALRAAGRVSTEQQNELSAIVESSEDAIISRGNDGIIRTWNPAAERLFQYSAAEAIGRHISMLYPPEQSRAVAVEPSHLTREPFTVSATRKDGTRVPLSVRVSLLRDADGVVSGAAVLARDMTTQTKAQADLERAEEQLRQAQKMESVGRLAGGIAHDFNNLLTVILSYTDLALGTLSPAEPLHADIVQIHAAGERASALTRQLLAFSRQQVLSPAVIDLNNCARRMETILERVLGEDIQLTLLLEKDLGKVFADVGQLEQVLMNLVVNARDAMPAGGSLTIETANVEIDASYALDHHDVAPGSYVMIAVTDTGTGIDPAIRHRIFDPFFTTKEQGKGTGLGLSMVFGLVKQSGGHVWAYSEPNVGSTFKVYLPRSDRSETERAPVSEARPVRGSETILLVEDDDAVRKVMCTMLRKCGYNVLDARNGGEALLVCEQYPARIDLLLTDVVMPRMSGRALAERLATLRPQVRVLYVSGYTENSVVHHGVLDAGIAYLQKPVTPDTLARKVREVLSA